eukprot:8023050-Pyramimonas_sp.AAC.1
MRRPTVTVLTGLGLVCLIPPPLPVDVHQSPRGGPARLSPRRGVCAAAFPGRRASSSRRILHRRRAPHSAFPPMEKHGTSDNSQSEPRVRM